jgi:hypothetical protein
MNAVAERRRSEPGRAHSVARGLQRVADDVGAFCCGQFAAVRPGDDDGGAVDRSEIERVCSQWCHVGIRSFVAGGIGVVRGLRSRDASCGAAAYRERG